MEMKNRKKLDNRIRNLIENGVHAGHRSLFVLVGEKSRDQVSILYKLLTRAFQTGSRNQAAASTHSGLISGRPSVLWCYKKELGFSTHRKKRLRMLEKRKKMGLLNRSSAASGHQATEGDDDDDDDLRQNLFDEMIASANIRWCYYHETHRILGNTYGALVLQDFEAMTPNLLARAVETVAGGGLVILLLASLSSLAQLRTLAMDVHGRYRTDAHRHVEPRFNERLVLSLADLPATLVLDDRLTVIPISSLTRTIEAISGGPQTAPAPDEDHNQLKNLIDQLRDTQPVGALLERCRTFDQGHALLKCVDALSERNNNAAVTSCGRGVVSLTAARGRGKSASLGLAIAAAIGLNYSNIFVTSPSPENLKTLFEFVLNGFDALGLQEHHDYDLIQSSPAATEGGNQHATAAASKTIIRINVHRAQLHRQTIAYMHPADAAATAVLRQAAELLIIDEAAAIPLPLVKALLGPYLVFMSSTVNGYEGTGRSLSLKLIKQLRQQAANKTTGGGQNEAAMGGRIHSSLWEVTLEESIRYRAGDPVEKWLNSLLCLDASQYLERPLKAIGGQATGGCPPPGNCSLYYINRDTLFSYHAAAEEFLQRLMALYAAAHYRNSPNDLQMMSDAPAHHLFCLLPPSAAGSGHNGGGGGGALPEVLTFVQVCLEGDISREAVMSGLARGRRAAGDLIPWTVSQQFKAVGFAAMSGGRIVRIVTHPNYQRMGYAARTLQLLEDYYRGQFDVNLQEEEEEDHDGDQVHDGDGNGGLATPRTHLKPLLVSLSERPAERLDYLGVSYGLSADLFKFWKRSGYVPVYLRQTAQDLTGEHSMIMLKDLRATEEATLISDGLQATSDGLAATNGPEKKWIYYFARKFAQRFSSLLSFDFRKLSATLAMSILDSVGAAAAAAVARPHGGADSSGSRLTKQELDAVMDTLDLDLLEDYARSLIDYHQVMDLFPALAAIYFRGRLGPEIHLSPAQAVLFLGVALQRKSLDEMAGELGLPANQLLALLQRSVARLAKHLKAIETAATERELFGIDAPNVSSVGPQIRRGDGGGGNVATELDAELIEAGTAVEQRHRREELERLIIGGRGRGRDGSSALLSQYAIKGTQHEWDKAMGRAKIAQSSLVSIRTLDRKRKDSTAAATAVQDQENEDDDVDSARRLHKDDSALKTKKKKRFHGNKNRPKTMSSGGGRAGGGHPVTTAATQRRK